MFSVISSSHLDPISDSILNTLDRKTNKPSLSETSLHKLVKIANSTAELSKYGAGLADVLKMMPLRMFSPTSEQPLENFICNCSDVTSGENSAADPLMHKVINNDPKYSVDISGAGYSNKEKAAEDNKTSLARKFYTGYEKNISEELQKIPAMDVKELVELIKMRDDIFLPMRKKEIQARKDSDENLDAECCALRQKVNEYNPVIRNQEFLYEATHGTGIQFKQQHIPPRRGEHCKLVALSLLDAFFAERMGKGNVPLLKEKHYDVSLRQMAKAEGSLQGEVLDSTMLKKLAEKIGYSVEMVRPESLSAFKHCLQNNISGKGIIIFYTLETGDLHYIYDESLSDSYDAIETFEHASVISWYDSEREICTLNYWQEKYPGIPVELLYKSNQSLRETRRREFYSLSEPRKHLNKDYSDPEGRRLYKYRVEHYPQSWSVFYQKKIDNKVTLSPEPGTGYKGLVMLIEPDKNHCRWDPQQQYVLRKLDKKRIEWAAKPQS